MAEYKAHKYKTKKGHDVIIRSATTSDAEQVLALAKSVIDEEIYQLTASEEFNMTIEFEESWIESHRLNPNHILLIAEMNSQIVGMLDFANGHRKRIAHTGDFGMSIASAAREQGIGQLLLKSLIHWATHNQAIEKIGLTVHANNERAIALYQKLGFQTEGIRKKELKYGDGHYVDTIVMGLFV